MIVKINKHAHKQTKNKLDKETSKHRCTQNLSFCGEEDDDVDDDKTMTTAMMEGEEDARRLVSSLLLMGGFFKPLIFVVMDTAVCSSVGQTLRALLAR